MNLRYRAALMLVFIPVLALATAFATWHSAAADDDDGTFVQFSAYLGSATDLRTVTYGGFAGNEMLAFTFYDPSGSQVMIGQSTTYRVATEADGTGNFAFRATDLFANPFGGIWTVQVVGQTSGTTQTTSFRILVDDN